VVSRSLSICNSLIKFIALRTLADNRDIYVYKLDVVKFVEIIPNRDVIMKN